MEGEDKNPQNGVGRRRLPPPSPSPSPRKADVKADKQAIPVKHEETGRRAVADNASTEGEKEREEETEGRRGKEASGAVSPSRRRGVWVARARRASTWV